MVNKTETLTTQTGQIKLSKSLYGTVHRANSCVIFGQVDTTLEVYGINLYQLSTFRMIMMQPFCYGTLFSIIKSNMFDKT